MGASDKAEQTSTQTYSSWESAVINFQWSDQFRGSAGSFDGCGTRLLCCQINVALQEPTL